MKRVPELSFLFSSYFFSVHRLHHVFVHILRASYILNSEKFRRILLQNDINFHGFGEVILYLFNCTHTKNGCQERQCRGYITSLAAKRDGQHYLVFLTTESVNVIMTSITSEVSIIVLSHVLGMFWRPFVRAAIPPATAPTELASFPNDIAEVVQAL